MKTIYNTTEISTNGVTFNIVTTEYSEGKFITTIGCLDWNNEVANTIENEPDAKVSHDKAIELVTGSIFDMTGIYKYIEDRFKPAFEPKKLKGMTVDIVKPSYGSASNGGISERFDKCLLVGEGIPEIFEAGDLPVVKIENHYKNCYRAVELNPDKGDKVIGAMFGGCHIYSSDGRFPFSHPIKLHDRFETQEQYDRLSR